MDPAVLEKRAAQVQRMLERADKPAEHICPGCNLLKGRGCVCAALVPILRPCLAVRHSLTILLHPKEASRASSTHRILRAAFGPRAAVKRWLEPGATSLAEVHAGITEACEATGQVPVILYPSPTALSPTQLLARLTPAQAKAGLHILVLDGTWADTKAMARGLHSSGSAASPSPYTCLQLGPSDILCQHSLFQVLRRQPHPDRISTVEAVASCLEALHGSVHPEAMIVPLPPSPTPPSLHEELLPACPYTPARRLRLALAVVCDSLAKQGGVAAPGYREGEESAARGMRGGGYRTWKLGPGGAGPWLGSIPAYLLEHIAVLAHGRDRVSRAGYRPRHAAGMEAEWRAGGSGDAAGEASTSSSSSSAGALAAAPSVVDVRKPWVKSRFPTPTVYTAVPLARVSKDMIEWAAGGRRVRRCRLDLSAPAGAAGGGVEPAEGRQAAAAAEGEAGGSSSQQPEEDEDQ